MEVKELGHLVLYVRDIEASGLFRRLRTLDSPQGSVVNLGGRDVINFSSNDYLGLASSAEKNLTGRSENGNLRVGLLVGVKLSLKAYHR